MILIPQLPRSFHKAALYACATLTTGFTLATAYNLGAPFARDHLESPQAKDIHQAFQVRFTNKSGQQLVYTNAPLDFESVDINAVVEPQLKSISEVVKFSTKLLQDPGSNNLASIRISTRDITDGKDNAFTLPNGRSSKALDENGKLVSVESLPLGTPYLAGKAIEHLKKQQSIHEDFDARTENPKGGMYTISGLFNTAGRYISTTQVYKYVYDHRPRFK